MVDPIPAWIRIQGIPTLALWVTIPAPDPQKNGIVTPLRGSESVSQLRQWREKGVTDLAQEFDRSIVARGSERHFSLSLSICFHNYQTGVLQFFLVYGTG